MNNELAISQFQQSLNAKYIEIVYKFLIFFKFFVLIVSRVLFNFTFLQTFHLPIVLNSFCCCIAL